MFVDYARTTALLARPVGILNFAEPVDEISFLHLLHCVPCIVSRTMAWVAHSLLTNRPP